MKIRGLYNRLMNEAGEGAAAGGAVDAAAATTSTQEGAGAGGSEEHGNESLLRKPGEATQEAQPGDAPSWLPEKYRVNGADGKLDLEASGKKMNEGLAAAVKRIGGDGARPETADAYKFEPGEKYQDVKFDDAMSKSFREFCHAKGITQEQYQGLMEQYLDVVPGVLDATLKVSVAEAREALQQVWKTTAEFDAGLSAAQRAIDSAPEQIRESLWARFGRDPEFIQFAASIGREMREDTSAHEGTTHGNTDVETLMASEAYRNSAHADHARVSAQVSNILKKRHGETPIFG